MSYIIDGDNCLLAWKSGLSYLKENGTSDNLILNIENPAYFDREWVNKYNPKILDNRVETLANVINTIFPYKLWERNNGDRNSFYNKYRSIYLKGKQKRKNRNKWGTYFHRLINFNNNINNNQLENAINKLNSWNQRYTSAFYFHLASPDTDSFRPMGGPCWQYGEILWNDNNTLDLVVIYRNHYYFQKALGNFIALGQLLNFICTNTNKVSGKLICHSVHATIDTTIRNLDTLINL